MNTAKEWINYLHLQAHPEGGYFSENYRNSIELTINNKYSGKRSLATSIYYMLESGQVSKLHQLKSDEIWYFHLGSPLVVHLFLDNSYQSYMLGVNINQVPQLIIPAGAIFGAEVVEKKSFALIGCMVSPGFHFEDFELINRSEILSKFPNQKSIIEKLT
jgi:uncharacterized protein